jgi:predicted RNA-binding Zn-ribbon protein involved in translation (DUF1610 family)
MPDLISLTCPSCGGKLKVSRNATSLTCQHCGNEHMVKHDAAGAVQLEAFARCPICGRNDRAEKVTAVIASQTQEITGIEQKSEVIINAQGQQKVVVRDVPFTRKQVSMLGQRLVPPTPPDASHFWPYPQPPGRPGRTGGVIIIVLGLVAGFGSVITFVFAIALFFTRIRTDSIQSNQVLTALALSVMAGALILLVLLELGLGIYFVVRASKPDLKKQAEYQSRMDAVKHANEQVVKNHETALTRWNALYYCSRDDCVFIPGEGTSAPLAKMKEYLMPVQPTQ